MLFCRAIHISGQELFVDLTAEQALKARLMPEHEICSDCKDAIYRKECPNCINCWDSERVDAFEDRKGQMILCDVRLGDLDIQEEI